jgi:hypothetical protein
MANQHPEKQTQEERPQQLPIQLKFLLGVIALALALLVLKFAGVI